MGERPYDPVEELGGASASDLEKAMALHATRSEKAQAMDESIQYREQVTDFEEWAESPNMMDFVGVDDLEKVLGVTEQPLKSYFENAGWNDKLGFARLAIFESKRLQSFLLLS